MNIETHNTPEGIRDLVTHADDAEQMFYCTRTSCALRGLECLARRATNNTNCLNCETGDYHDSLFGEGLVGMGGMFDVVNAKKLHNYALRIIRAKGIELETACKQMGVAKSRFNQSLATWTLSVRKRVRAWVKMNDPAIKG